MTSALGMLVGIILFAIINATTENSLNQKPNTTSKSDSQ